MFFDGRGAARIETESLLAFRLLDAENQVINEGMVKTIDISRTGIAIEAPLPMPPGQRIELTIGIGDDVVKTRGTVQNMNKLAEKKYQVGIQFDYLSEEDLSKIGMVYPDILK